MTLDERRGIWMGMADLLLDTETRHEIPAVAGRCVRAGLTVAEACDLWWLDVIPVVGHNLWQVAGEWAGWSDDWLFDQIENHPRPRCRLLWKLVGRPAAPFIRAVGRCMEVLAVGSVEQSLALEAQLRWLCGVFFDFEVRARPLPCPPDDLRRVYRDVFLPIFSKLDRWPMACELRVEARLPRSA
jgi:hypothetical protein